MYFITKCQILHLSPKEILMSFLQVFPSHLNESFCLTSTCFNISRTSPTSKPSSSSFSGVYAKEAFAFNFFLLRDSVIRQNTVCYDFIYFRFCWRIYHCLKTDILRMASTIWFIGREKTCLITKLNTTMNSGQSYKVHEVINATSAINIHNSSRPDLFSFWI